MSKTISTVSNNYVSMCKLMIESYNSLVSTLSKQEIKSKLDHDVWMFFGSSKAGKSTLLTRVKSGVSSSDFVNIIKLTESRGEEVTEFEGIQMRSGNMAMTTTPNLIIRDDQLYMDLAGFVDADPQREAVISLLNNCLFSKLNSCKMVIVMDINVLTAPTVLMRTYVQEIERLLTSQHYETGLRSCGFVFTKVDVYGKIVMDKTRDEDGDSLPIRHAVRSLLENYTVQMVGVNDSVAKLSAAIAKKHCIVDYSKQSSEDVVTMINKMMKDVPPLNSRSLFFDMVSATSTLSKESLVIIEQYNNLVIGLTKKFESLRTVINTTHQDVKGHVKKIRSDLINQQLVIESAKKRITASEVLLMNSKADKTTQEGLLKQLEDQRTVSENQQKASNKQISNFKSLWMVALKSTMKGTLLSGKINRVCAEVVRPIGCHDKINVFIMSDSDFERQLQIIENCVSYEVFKKLQLPYLYNNGYKMGVNQSTIMVDLNGSDDKFARIVTSSESSHVVLCLCDVKIMDTKLNDLMNEYFTDQLSQITKNIAKSNAAIKMCEKNFKSCSEELEKSQLIIRTGEEKCTEFEAKINSIKNEFKVSSEGLSQQVSDLMSQLRKVQSDEVLKVTEELGKILVSSNVEVKSYGEIPSIRQTLDVMLDKESLLNGIIQKNVIEIYSF